MDLPISRDLEKQIDKYRELQKQTTGSRPMRVTAVRDLIAAGIAAHQAKAVATEVESSLPPESDAPGLQHRYQVRKADGTPCDPNAKYFVLRLDAECKSAVHLAACRAAALSYAECTVGTSLEQVGQDLVRWYRDQAANTTATTHDTVECGDETPCSSQRQAIYDILVRAGDRTHDATQWTQLNDFGEREIVGIVNDILAVLPSRQQPKEEDAIIDGSKWEKLAARIARCLFTYGEGGDEIVADRLHLYLGATYLGGWAEASAAKCILRDLIDGP